MPSTYPVALAVSQDGTRAFVALWNASEVVELDLKNGVVGRKLALLKPSNEIAPGTHPCALEISADGRTMYVALANRDAVAAVNLDGGQFSVKGYFDTRLPGQSYFGAEPEALALSPDGSRLYVANAVTDAIAVMDTRALTAKAVKQGMVEPMGFVPTEWMPMSMAFAGDKLYVATAKGKGTGPNNFPQRMTESNREADEAEFNLYWDAAVWVAGDAGYGGDGEGVATVDGGGGGVEPDEGGGREAGVFRRLMQRTFGMKRKGKTRMVRSSM